jgi:DNA processing protein
MMVLQHADASKEEPSHSEILRGLVSNQKTAALRNPELNFEEALQLARAIVKAHLEQNIFPVPITDDLYPPLLKLISDPPGVLYVKGNISILKHIDAVAIVGTRTPTKGGVEVARKVASFFARSGYLVVSGLARGIDTAAHEATLTAKGPTVAVLGTGLDQIYPAENKPVAEHIISSGGALITEIPIGQRSFKAAFVRRDRIQSGMSLGIVAVQTDLKGGTMHTVRFALAQRRVVLCPKPLPREDGLQQYKGIWDLIHSGKAVPFQARDYPKVIARLEERKRELISALGSIRDADRSGHGGGPFQGTLGLLESF